MAAPRRMLQIRDAMLSVVRIKFSFEMLAFRAIITWTLWLLLLLLLLVALRNWLIIYSLCSSSFKELCLCSSESRSTKEKDWMDHESNKSTVRGRDVLLTEERQRTSMKEVWLLSMKYIPRACLCVFAHLPFRCCAYLWPLHNHVW